MKSYHILASLHKLGKRCASCTIHVDVTVSASNPERAIVAAKESVRLNEETHQFKLQSIKEV